jgi:proteasome activator subunit 4
MNTPQLRNGSAGDYLSAPLMKAGHFKSHTYLAGSKALDSLAKMIASTESFFHPSNSGTWTADVCVCLSQHHSSVEFGVVGYLIY